MEESALAIKFPYDKINTSQSTGVDAYGNQRWWEATAIIWTHIDPYRSHSEVQPCRQVWQNKFPVVYLCQTHWWESTNSWWVFTFRSGVRGVSELLWSWTRIPLPWPPITVGIINKLITEGLFVFSFVFAWKGGGCKAQTKKDRDMGGGWEGLCAKGLSSLPDCVLLPLALSSPIKPATPQQ